MPEALVHLRRSWAVQQQHDVSDDPPYASMSKLLEGELLFK
jgi:hypothetical protein